MTTVKPSEGDSLAMGGLATSFSLSRDVPFAILQLSSRFVCSAMLVVQRKGSAAQAMSWLHPRCKPVLST